jgi:DNA sulfur modification protein DndC
MRWCTRVLKIKPMALQMKADTTMLLITGVREGESAIRDGHITAACSKDGGECGQGYLYVKSVEKGYATIAPILGWRVCHVYDWLTLEAPCDGFDTSLIAEVYGYDPEDRQEEPLSARTGCINCPLVTSPQDKPKPDKMVERVLALPHYQYLAPLRKLLDLYVELTDDRYHLQKDGTQRLKNGGIPKNLYRKGPLTMEARRYGLATVKAIQDEVNRAARACKMPEVSLISAEEEACILDLIAANTWPQAWSGTEPLASEFTPPDEHTALAQQLELLLEGQRG